MGLQESVRSPGTGMQGPGASSWYDKLGGPSELGWNVPSMSRMWGGAQGRFGVRPVPAGHGVMGQEGFALAIPRLMIAKES